MNTNPLLSAAQYLRMSTDDQQYSIANQEEAIRAYARNHGYMITSNYTDAGKSGIAIKQRKELRRLLSDVISGRASYKAILVYDVSRWGRFQDVDEGAHYEFLCRSAGIPVRYCAEQFENDGSLSSSMMKALKRTMAAEYSRELSIKTSAGQRRLALIGFHVAGMAGYGLRRMMVSPDGRRRLVLEDGERKAIQANRTILVPGPKRECDCIRLIFSLAVESRMTPREIAGELNVRQMRGYNRQPWNRSSVYHVLTSAKYAGTNVYGKTTQALASCYRPVERRLWTVKSDAFVPIVSRETFNHAQTILTTRAGHPDRSDGYFIQGMKRVLAKEGRLTKRILEQKFRFSHAYYKRFGSVMKAYELSGFRPPPAIVKLINTQSHVRSLRHDLYCQLKKMFPDRLRFISLPGQQFRQIVEIDGQLRVATYLCRAIDNTCAGKPGWLLRVRSLERDLAALICTIDHSHSTLLEFYLFAPFGNAIPKYRVLREDGFLLSAECKLNKLDEFCDKALEITSQPLHTLNVTVDDIQMATDTWTIVLGAKEITLGPVGSAILKLLLLNSGDVISRDQLQRSVPAKFLDTTNLNAHISRLRVKLGDARDRIRRVPGVGYLYVSPNATLPADGYDGAGVVSSVDTSRPRRRISDLQSASVF
jgi:DNA invertase Pin-like site-specific DNA recombinase/DNA-binding winged helix-turn-helix (wHTH) protein